MRGTRLLVFVQHLQASCTSFRLVRLTLRWLEQFVATVRNSKNHEQHALDGMHYRRQCWVWWCKLCRAVVKMRNFAEVNNQSWQWQEYWPWLSVLILVVAALTVTDNRLDKHLKRNIVWTLMNNGSWQCYMCYTVLTLTIHKKLY